MTARDEFNTLLLEFVDQLKLVFPEVPELATYSSLAPTIIKSQPEAPMKMYLQTTKDHSVKILAKDASFFDDCPQLMNLNIKTLWSKDLSQNTRDIIWTYIAHLHTLAITSALPDSTMAKLQDVAKDLMQQMSNGSADMSQLLGMVQDLPK